MESEKLTESAKVAINSYLLKWFSALGIINIVALLLGLSYIFFYIPQEAANKANILITEEIHKQTSLLKNITLKSTTEALIQSARVQERAALIEVEAKHLTKTVRLLRVKVNEIKEDDVIKVKELSELLEKNTKLNSVIDIENRLNVIEQKPIWPSGKYCIISNESCPKGFTKSEGYMRAISLYPNGQ